MWYDDITKNFQFHLFLICSPNGWILILLIVKTTLNMLNDTDLRYCCCSFWQMSATQRRNSSFQLASHPTSQWHRDVSPTYVYVSLSSWGLRSYVRLCFTSYWLQWCVGWSYEIVFIRKATFFWTFWYQNLSINYPPLRYSYIIVPTQVCPPSMTFFQFKHLAFIPTCQSLQHLDPARYINSDGHVEVHQ